MVEIVFGENANGSLKIAQHYGAGKYPGGSVGVIVSHSDGSKPTKKEIAEAQKRAEEQSRLEWECAVPMGGDPSDVYSFGLALSIGDISEIELGEKRRNILEWLYGAYPDEEARTFVQHLWETAKASMTDVLTRCMAGEPIRIWYSDNADELCGLYWLMALIYFRGAPCNKIYLVKLPAWEYDERKQSVLQKNSWGDVAPGEWHTYVSLQKLAPPVFCRSCAAQWESLQRENAPLRAVINGRLTSMPETLYDDLIVREIRAEAEEFQESVVIGRVLGKYQLGVSDVWVASRIDAMIRAGKLEICGEAVREMPNYHRRLKKAIEQ